MFEPEKYENRYCTKCNRQGVKLKPVIGTVQGIKGIGTIFHVEYWYCPECGLMYYFEDLKTIVEKGGVVEKPKSDLEALFG